jgi:hypothetical protein
LPQRNRDSPRLEAALKGLGLAYTTEWQLPDGRSVIRASPLSGDDAPRAHRDRRSSSPRRPYPDVRRTQMGWTDVPLPKDGAAWCALAYVDRKADFDAAAARIADVLTAPGPKMRVLFSVEQQMAPH